MITCWLCQRIVSIRIDANSALPQWARAHMENCAACRDTCRSATALAQQLSSTANDQRRCAPRFLHGKIMSAVRARENAELQSGRARLGWAVAAGMACLLATSLIWLRQPPVSDHSGLNSIPSASVQALNVRLPSVDQMDQWTKSLDAPLEQETKLVLLDATKAVNTLARSFLPEDLVASSTEPGRH